MIMIITTLVIMIMIITIPVPSNTACVVSKDLAIHVGAHKVLIVSQHLDDQDDQDHDIDDDEDGRLS